MFAANEPVGDEQGSAAPPASRKSLSQALDQARLAAGKQCRRLELPPRSPGSTDSVPRRAGGGGISRSHRRVLPRDHTLYPALLSPAMSRPARPRSTHHLPVMVGECTSNQPPPQPSSDAPELLLFTFTGILRLLGRTFPQKHHLWSHLSTIT